MHSLPDMILLYVATSFYIKDVLHEIYTIYTRIVRYISRRAVVSREAKKKQHAYASSGQCDHYSELFTRMDGLNF